ncbi:unnamed protein product [Blumeria hordei]|uniref:Uncharacterized protein n=1 Tax=Blumeria hordei TaxID=2867405 RepID=A0A383V330_BLUHO|nr:unnamed protein product [Blumeria hordei]
MQDIRTINIKKAQHFSLSPQYLAKENAGKPSTNMICDV